MSVLQTNFSLKYDGREADLHTLDFYDASQALVGFQRSLAIVTHLVLNDKIITQAPSLSGAKIWVRPPQEGSWEIIAAVIGGVGYIGTRPKDTPLGHLVASAYDYVIKSALGFHVDYDSTLGKQYDEINKNTKLQKLDATRFDSAVEKCEPAFIDMHRPIVKSKTAKSALLREANFDFKELNVELNEETFDYISKTDTIEIAEDFVGNVSSYNINTFRGRVYIRESNRPIPFKLADSAKNGSSVALIAQSLMLNAVERINDIGDVKLVAFRHVSRTGRLKSIYVLEVTKARL